MTECLADDKGANVSCRNAEAAGAGPGVFLLPLPVLGAGVHAELPDSPALPLHQVQAPKQHYVNCVSLSKHSWTAATSCQRALICVSMQQGKMFFFIGVMMALIQGGYARRIKPGNHISAVHTVRSLSVSQRGVDHVAALACSLINIVSHFRQS